MQKLIGIKDLQPGRLQSLLNRALTWLDGWRAWLEVWRMRVCRMEIRAPRLSDQGMETLLLQQRAASCPFGCCAEGSDTNCPIFQRTELNRTG